jgi:REP element-mobilizing transposase RayT
MPGSARKEIVAADEVSIYHCTTRCVRRAFLCGQDPVTAQDYAHRKAWVVQRLQHLAGVFAVEVCAYAVMSNHVHLILRIRPDVVAQWSDEYVVRRWGGLHPARCLVPPDPPAEEQVQATLQNPQRIAELRTRLASLSWFMAQLNEYLARAANAEDEVTGRFWEGRFRCVRLLDEAALLACSVYVDLNPIRARLADTPETSSFTSVFDRIQDLRAAHDAAADAIDSGQDVCPAELATGRSDWLAPIPHADSASRAQSSSPAAPETLACRRASDRGLFSLSVEQ